MKTKSIFILISILALVSCKKNPPKYIYNDGIIHGAPYHIVYESQEAVDFHTEIDTLMKDLNMIFSTYEKESVISKVNRNEDVELDSVFTKAFNQSIRISELSDGAFDITCGPIINAWGFGPEERKKMTPEIIDSLLQITGFRKIKLENGKVIKESPQMKISMNAIGDGLFCDRVAQFLERKKCANYLVEIGGEVTAKGRNEKGNIWTIGINKPIDENQFVNNEIVAKIQIENKSMATSGNYRNFYIEDGKKYAHTIDPKTGYPVEHSLLSATVLADNGTDADGFATAFMVLGIGKSIELSQLLPSFDVYFIYADSTGNKVYMSEGFKKYIKE